MTIPSQFRHVRPFHRDGPRPSIHATLRRRPAETTNRDDQEAGEMERMYGWQGLAHAELGRRIGRAARGEAGQGTVEYVGLILLVAVILAGVVKASGGLKDSTIAEAVIKKLKTAIDEVGKG